MCLYEPAPMWCQLVMPPEESVLGWDPRWGFVLGSPYCSLLLFRPQDGSKPAETSQPQSSTTGYSQPSLGYGQSNYSYPQVPASYPMQPVTAPPSYPPTR